MWRNAKRLPTGDILIRRQQNLETTLAAFADGELRQATARISDPGVHDASGAHLIRPSKHLRWAWRSSTPHTPSTPTPDSNQPT
ncbi:hypothetical protein [Streptomyces atratus]|uniref:hypothetical protein n=1 Tax=Streptomyces atratus TaxID=1893 RepID=UPI00224F5833|nr:hypothetical protein [Streptomyces atratus]MCX5346054.1 hypothetical protein [Streptomyces atratus]